MLFMFKFVFVILYSLFAALLSPAGKGLTHWLSGVLYYLVFVSLSPYSVTSQAWHLILFIFDLCLPCCNIYRNYLTGIFGDANRIFECVRAVQKIKQK